MTVLTSVMMSLITTWWVTLHSCWLVFLNIATPLIRFESILLSACRLCTITLHCMQYILNSCFLTQWVSYRQHLQTLFIVFLKQFYQSVTECIQTGSQYAFLLALMNIICCRCSIFGDFGAIMQVPRFTSNISVKFHNQPHVIPVYLWILKICTRNVKI